MGLSTEKETNVLHIRLLLKQFEVMCRLGPIFLTFKSLKDECELGLLKTIPEMQCTKAANW